MSLSSITSQPSAWLRALKTCCCSFSCQDVQLWTCWTQLATGGASVSCLSVCHDGIWTRTHTSVTVNMCLPSLWTSGLRGILCICNNKNTSSFYSTCPSVWIRRCVFFHFLGVLQVPQRDPAHVWRSEQQQVTLERAGWGIQRKDEGHWGWEEEIGRRGSQER